MYLFRSKVLCSLFSKGKQFSIWTLSDLEDCDRTVKFFLFGEVHKQLWKTQYGTVVGILNANIMPTADKVGALNINLNFRSCELHYSLGIFSGIKIRLRESVLYEMKKLG